MELRVMGALSNMSSEQMELKADGAQSKMELGVIGVSNQMELRSDYAQSKMVLRVIGALSRLELGEDGAQKDDAYSKMEL
ncbi:hypothetical protein P7K49_029767 [Saguinus oedipus]|uniref:Uncharacterized protein n=1 Tax=Saguinus oedipus TaxID=9490 RepID=A0ABQ9U847_SAGOE|nr:hypothetical protein P7K49_029767 [Saguinus oedipus]